MKRDHHQIPFEVAEEIGHYVYVLRDPRDGQVFYVGKGQGNRVFSHQKQAGTSVATQNEKLRRIKAIESNLENVEHLFIRTHLRDDEEAFAVEQAVVDAYKASKIPLTNLVGGHQSTTQGLASVSSAIADFSAKEAPGSKEPTLLFSINRSWRRDLTEKEIYLYTRGHWIVGNDARAKAIYAFGVAHGIIRGVYKIESWFPSKRRGEKNKWGFNGDHAIEMEHFLGTSVRRLKGPGNQNPYGKYLSGIPGPKKQISTK
jgi:hypothetical protein